MQLPQLITKRHRYTTLDQTIASMDAEVKATEQRKAKADAKASAKAQRLHRRAVWWRNNRKKVIDLAPIVLGLLLAAAVSTTFVLTQGLVGGA